MDKKAKIYIAGHKGMVGSAIVRKLKEDNYENLIFSNIDLRIQSDVIHFFETNKPEYVFVCAAKVGGIYANKEHKAEFIYDNIAIQTNLIHQAYKSNAKKLLFLGSSCIYPKFAPQPIKEEYLMTGELEATNDAYAIAKIAGIKMCQSYNEQYGCNFISLMPTNLYGPNDNYDLLNSHVLPALLKKFHSAKKDNHDSVEVWGTGEPKREFLFVDDLADACLFLMKNYNQPDIINVGTGIDISIKELALLIKKVVGYHGQIKYNTSQPDGTPRKLLDVSKINNLGWKAKTDLEEGLKITYNNFLTI